MKKKGAAVAPKEGQKSKRLSREDWVEAALMAIAEGGLAAVAVEPLAKRLNVTKGSFYWHFKNRDELVKAALDRWEGFATDEVVDRVDPTLEPADMMRALMVESFRDGSLVARTDLALMAEFHDPRVRPYLKRVLERRIQIATAAHEQLGMGPSVARHRAVLACTSHFGVILAQAIGARPLDQRDALDAFLTAAADWLLEVPKA